MPHSPTSGSLLVHTAILCTLENCDLSGRISPRGTAQEWRMAQWPQALPSSLGLLWGFWAGHSLYPWGHWSCPSGLLCTEIASFPQLPSSPLREPSSPATLTNSHINHLQFRRPGFDPWVGKIPWRRERQPTPVFLPGEFPWTEEPGGLQRVEHPSRPGC